jgi:hypothetical protein
MPGLGNTGAAMPMVFLPDSAWVRLYPFSLQGSITLPMIGLPLYPAKLKWRIELPLDPGSIQPRAGYAFANKAGQASPSIGP